MEATWMLILLIMTTEATVKGTEDREVAAHASTGPGNIPFIVNGKDALPGSWPWQVRLRGFAGGSCGGILLSKLYVLTAAHCQPSFGQVILGRRNLSSNDGAIRRVRNATIHPDYDYRTIRNDIAVVELDVPVRFTANIQPALLPKTSDNFVGSDCFATGWGKTSGNSRDSPTILQEVSLPVISNLQCQVGVHPIGVIHSSNICVYDAKSGVCQGDSGGPLQCRRCCEEPWVISGVTSWGVSRVNDTCVLDAPNVFTRTSSYIDWIQKKTNYEARVVDLDNDGECRPGMRGCQTSSVMPIVNSITLMLLSLACTLTSSG